MKRERQTGKTICPFVEKPFDNCFVNRLSSYTIRDVVAFCGKDYEACEIYLKNNGIEKGNNRTAVIQ
ncbi:MAG: hypothetical protein JSV13_01760 [Nitrospiraceae bacterium]|jgi:hypothetical protein|nr:MAG: hypothetical protein JSV13_01760 [Nitrospiraceae bacterium]